MRIERIWRVDARPDCTVTLANAAVALASWKSSATLALEIAFPGRPARAEDDGQRDTPPSSTRASPAEYQSSDGEDPEAGPSERDHGSLSPERAAEAAERQRQSSGRGDDDGRHGPDRPLAEPGYDGAQERTIEVRGGEAEGQIRRHQ